MIRCTVAVAGTQLHSSIVLPRTLSVAVEQYEGPDAYALCNRSSLTQPRSSQYNNCRSREQSDRTDTESRLLCKALILLLSLSPIREKVRILTPQGREGSLRAHAYAVRVGYIYLGACYETLLDPVRPPYPSLHFSSLLHPLFYFNKRRRFILHVCTTCNAHYTLSYPARPSSARCRAAVGHR